MVSFVASVTAVTVLSPKRCGVSLMMFVGRSGTTVARDEECSSHWALGCSVCAEVGSLPGTVGARGEQPKET
jgi:hypothetical protein